MHAATSKVENSAQGSSCKLKFVHELTDLKEGSPSHMTSSNGKDKHKSFFGEFEESIISTTHNEC
jgi:hypothetical protein